MVSSRPTSSTCVLDIGGAVLVGRLLERYTEALENVDVLGTAGGFGTNGGLDNTGTFGDNEAVGNIRASGFLGRLGSDF